MTEQDGTNSWDDSAGGSLKTPLMRSARDKEMEYVKKMNILPQGAARREPTQTKKWRHSRAKRHSATLPLEAVRLLLSWAATGRGCSTCLAHIDVSRAHFFHVMIPEEDMSEGDRKRCAKLNASLYGKRAAQKNCSTKYSSELVKLGF